MISLCTISCNAEYLNRMLSIVRPYVGEAIVVYGNKEHQDVVRIAQSFNCKVFYREFDNDFAEQRNFSIQKSNGDWIFVLDDDEVPSFDLLGYIYNVDENKIDDFDLLKIYFKDYYRFQNNSYFHLNANYRFYKKILNFKYRNMVHEEIDLKEYPNIRVFELPIEDGIIYHEKTIEKQSVSNKLYEKISLNGKKIIKQSIKR